MSSRKWLTMFISSVLTIAIVISGFNMFTDPFGVYGDKFFDWYSYNFTNNPRVAKIAYLDDNHEKFDSYLIGSSATSSFPIDKLNKYMDANFYNLFMYGADIYDVDKTVEYVINNYEVKNIVLNLGVINAERYNYETDELTGNLHAKADHSSLLKFHFKYLFANPRYGMDKILDYRKDGYLPEEYDVFDVSTGAYDKSQRDIEHIQDIDSYKENYPTFNDYPDMEYNLEHIDDMVSSVKNIKNVCDNAGVNIEFVFFPMHYEHSRYLDSDKVEEVYSKISEITDFWDFSVNSITTDPRFYYDETHFRNTLGDMALAKMFGDEDVYMPEDFGVHVTKENAKEQAKAYKTEYKFDDSNYTKEVPILMYHHLSEEQNDDLQITAENFEDQIKTLSEAGYNGVLIEELMDYVEKGVELPKNPVVITFDDGYSSNYEIAYPILKKYNMKATIFIVGSSVGKDSYKDTEYEIKPHFSYKQAKEMIDSGLIDIQSHSYDMHQSQDYEDGIVRTSMTQLEKENEEDFIKTIRDDISKSKEAFEKDIDRKMFALAYPLGQYNDLTEVILNEMGINVTFTTEPGINTIVKGLPQSLRTLKRFTADGNLSGEELIDLFSNVD